MAAVREEFGSSRLFVLKDPRISRILPFWLDVLKAIGATPLVISAVRNPLEVAASLARREGIDLGLGHLLWLRHMLDAEFASRGIPRFFASYDRLVGGGWGSIVKDSQSALGISWPRMSDQVSAEIEAFLSETFRHHRQAPENVVDNPTLGTWLRSTFQILSDWASSGENSGHFAQLDQIRMELNGAAPAFSRLISAGQERARKTQKLEEALAYREQQLANVSSELGAAHQRLEQSERALKEVRHQLAQTESALAQRRHEAEQTAAEVAAARGELSQAAAARAESEKIIAGLKEHVVFLLADLKERQAALAEQNRGFAATGLQVKKILATLDTARLEALSKLDAQVQEAARLKREAEERAAAAEAAAAEGQQLKAQLAEQSKETAKLKRETEERAAAAEAAVAEGQQLKARLAEQNAEQSKEIATLRGLVSHREGEAQSRRLEAERVRQAAAGEIGRAVAALLNGHRFPLPWTSLRLKRQIHLLKKSGVFDADWYLSQYRDVIESGMDPARHYLLYGALEGRQPNAVLAEAINAKNGEQGQAKE